ncbi:MAG: acetaldehyde dehydrogenase (acetylating) [Mycoplasmatales bacterium]
MDKDLQSIQEVRTLVKEADNAQAIFATFDQAKVDELCLKLSQVALANAHKLAEMAHVETGYGKTEDKVEKNTFAASAVYEAIKDMKTAGVINGNTNDNYAEIAIPVGVVAAIIPSTNPTSTAIYKILISIKSRNAIVLSPHPAAKKCIMETARIIDEELQKHGLPKGVINCISQPTLQATNELMKHPRTALILATGGTPMVKAAYSSGTPAIGVGPGNGPSIIEATADFDLALQRIVKSKTFDHGVICASEQSIVTTRDCYDKLMSYFAKNGLYLVNETSKVKLEKVLVRPTGGMNPQVVGRSAQYIADLAGVQIPDSTKVIVAHEDKVGRAYPFSMEKLCPVLGLYVCETMADVITKCQEILMHEGKGHTMSIHSQNQAVIDEVAEKMPVNRILINTLSALGGIGSSTYLFPALTLGCGAIGKSSTSDNISPLHLINIKRVSRDNGHIKLEQTRQAVASKVAETSPNVDQAALEAIVREVLKNLK